MGSKPKIYGVSAPNLWGLSPKSVGSESPQWPQGELHRPQWKVMVRAPPSGHNGNYILSMVTMNLTAPPSGHNENCIDPNGNSDGHSANQWPR